MVDRQAANEVTAQASPRADAPGAENHPSNVFTEFASSVYRSGVQRPVESISQIVGIKTAPVETDDKATGAMKLANELGNVTGQLLDFAALNRFTGSRLEALIGRTGAIESGTMLLNNPVARTVAIQATTGFAYGTLLTPLSDGENQSRRLINGLVDANTFAAMGAVSASYGARFADAPLGRAYANAIAGGVAGLVNVNLDAVSHGHVAGVMDDINSAGSWAVGNVLAGEGLHALTKGAQLMRPDSVSPAVLVPESLINALDHHAANDPEYSARSDSPGKEVADAAKPAIDAAAPVTDATTPRSDRAEPDMPLLSMKEIAQRGDVDEVRKWVTRYYPQLQKAFPLPGEIEDPETYVRYLMDPNFHWDMVQLLGPVRGGLQFQVLDVGGDKIQKAGWLEHIWVAEPVRQEGYGGALLKHVQTTVDHQGGNITFWEWNNPDKMSPEEILEDEKGGITTQDRVNYWGKKGAYVAVVPSTGEIAPYAQPGMDGQEEVPYLSLAWTKPGGLDGQTISKSDYKKTLTAAHGTITDVDSDPTVAANNAALDAIPDEEFQFIRLDDFIKRRTEQLNSQHQDGHARLQRWMGADIEPKQEN